MFSINDIVRLKGEIGYDDLSDIDICFDDADEIIGRTGTLLTISLKSEGVVKDVTSSNNLLFKFLVACGLMN